MRPMIRLDTAAIADTILAAPGWARVGITAPAPHLRSAAAEELARAIAAHITETGTAPTPANDPDQPGLGL